MLKNSLGIPDLGKRSAQRRKLIVRELGRGAA